MHEEDDVRNAIVFAAAALVVSLAGCQNQGNQASGIPVQPKWKGAPYRLAIGATPSKPSAAGLTLPSIKYTANPNALETRANLVVQFDTSGAKRKRPNDNGLTVDQMLMAPTDISGAEGALPADYVDLASKDLAPGLRRTRST